MLDMCGSPQLGYRASAHIPTTVALGHGSLTGLWLTAGWTKMDFVLGSGYGIVYRTTQDGGCIVSSISITAGAKA